MSSIIIPKERLTAYQRWEMASFDMDERVRQTGIVLRFLARTVPGAARLA